METKDVIIVGGGISGLSALHYIKKEYPDYKVTLYEADSRLGGTIGTDQIDNYSLDWGPNGFLDREPLTLELCGQLGLTDDLEKANQNANNRYILRKNKLRSVPMSPPKFLLSDILPLSGKLRVLMEPWAKPRPDGVDESVYDFVKRRIGVQAADYLVQPMVSGVYGGVAQKLSLRSCFSIMREMEDEYGSLFKAMIAKAKKAKAEGKKSGGPSGPGGWLTSFDGGLYKIIERFNLLYNDFIQTGTAVESIIKEHSNFTIRLSDNNKIISKKVILAVPSYKAAEITSILNNQLSSSLAMIKYAPISVVCSGYDAKDINYDINGFGFLVPSLEKRNILGSIWTSSIFKNRAPNGKIQFRTMLGGDGDHQSIELDETELVKRASRDLADILNITKEPEFVKTYRWKYGIPQYHIGHADVMNDIEKGLKDIGDIYITGNAYYGIGLNDCIKQSYKITRNL